MQIIKCLKNSVRVGYGVVKLTGSVSPLNNPSDSEKLESRPLSTEDRRLPTTILLIEGAFCTFELMGGIWREIPEALEARPSDETTLRTTRPLPVDGATGGLGACLLFEDGLNDEVETGLLCCLGTLPGGTCCC